MEVLGFLCSHLYVVFLIAARGHVSSEKSRFQPGTHVGIVKGSIICSDSGAGTAGWEPPLAARTGLGVRLPFYCCGPP